ncbi:hypothetical protein Q8W71_14715 [Methylobacterium sp. NEAU 140]|uniref:hypothetical protein n=1 Tax=Methylobacterium sp. NEAU 140 TaxID=3064945 RepID=UPI002736CF4E|nr:hypothetical protein [Methylobacterium sp. NEAU 140]MDP4023883.1 hypothetical protein [Methylobacterium sp. NEAU 140]
MAIEDRLRERLLKAKRLVAGASTASKRDAAAAAVGQLKAWLAASLSRSTDRDEVLPDRCGLGEAVRGPMPAQR